MNSENGRRLKLGSTLYSLTTEFHSRQCSFEDLVRKVAVEGLGPGLEVVGFQSIRGFPEVSDAFAGSFKDLIAETGLAPSCLAINADAWIDPDNKMSDDDSVTYHERQLEAAAKLGFPLVRYQYLAGPSVIERCLPKAEQLGVKMGLEIHAPQHSQHPVVLSYREMYERVGSPMLGFIPDFGSTSRAVPPSYFDAVRAKGVPAALIELAEGYWRSDEGLPHERHAAYIKDAARRGFDPGMTASMNALFALFGRADPRSWCELMPQVIHIHGKFFDFDESGDELAVDLHTVLPLFVEAGYDGYMSSEYEGHIWCDADGFDKIRRHHALANRILGPLQG